MAEGIKENQRPGMPVGAEPDITPEMVQSVFNVLESEGLIRHMKGGAYIPTEGGWKLLRENVSGGEIITAYGHESTTAMDEDCFEITTNKDPKGEDCVIAVNADKACKSLSNEFKIAAKSASRVFITIDAGGLVEKITAYGSPALKLTDTNEIVVRKTDFIDGKTVAILASKSANDFSKAMKEKLKGPNTKVEITLEVK